MKVLEQFSSLPQALGLEGQAARLAALCAFVEQLVHDLRGPAGTFRLEVFSARQELQRLEERGRSADMATVIRCTRVLGEILDNLDEAMMDLRRLLDGLEEASRPWGRGGA